MVLHLTIRTADQSTLADQSIFDAVGQIREGSAPRLTRECTFQFLISETQRADFRWYWEKFDESPFDPAPAMARRIERHMAGVGTDLFKQLFGAESGLVDLWAAASLNLHELRIEINAGDSGAAILPWELLRIPGGEPLALEVREFVRVNDDPAECESNDLSGTPLLLIVISRPAFGKDAAGFHSVARRVFGWLYHSPKPVGICVLRPATFEQLQLMLRRYKSDNEPFHLVHFDCHGETDKAGRGYLLFEKSFDRKARELHQGADYVDGTTLGNILTECGVRVVVLNACRSAYLESGGGPAESSLVGEMLATGLNAVLAMRYAISVESAAVFMGAMYAELTRGRTLSAAVSTARKFLATSSPIHAWDGSHLQDWPIPLFLERRPFRLFAEVEDQSELSQTALSPITEKARATENTILLLDRVMVYTDNLVINGMIGSGKSVVAREFASWFRLFGGTIRVIESGPPYRLTPERLVEDGRKALAEDLSAAGYRWEGLRSLTSRMAALRDVMFDIPVLWIWDDVDEVVAAVRGEGLSTLGRK